MSNCKILKKGAGILASNQENIYMCACVCADLKFSGTGLSNDVPFVNPACRSSIFDEGTVVYAL